VTLQPPGRAIDRPGRVSQSNGTLAVPFLHPAVIYRECGTRNDECEMGLKAPSIHHSSLRIHHFRRSR
jgi:hypothetical protein